ncbi:MAG: CDP-alcohol phosphatidyltransferase family protein [Patescibacteria group bacterium]
MNTDKKSLLDQTNDHIRAYRQKFFGPFLRVCTEFGISANFISNLRLALGALFLFVWFRFNFPILSAILILFVLLLDLFDGPLAHFQRKNSDRGKFLDVLIDQVVSSFMLIALLKLNISPLLITYSIFILFIAYILGTIKKAEFEESDWIIRTQPRLSYLKAFIVIPFFLMAFFGFDIIYKALLVASIVATILSLYYFAFIQLRWRKVSGK